LRQIEINETKVTKKIIKLIALLTVTILLAVPVVALFIDDETFSTVLETIPGTGQHAGEILKQKQGISMTLSGYVGSAFGGLETVYDGLFGDSPSSGPKKVVIDLPPLATPTAPPPSPVEPEQRGMSPSTSPPPPPLPAKAERKTIKPPVMPSPKKIQQAKAKPPVTQTAAPRAKPRARAPAKVVKAPKPPAKKDPTADQDHKRGLLFYKGIGVEKDFKKAALWFKRAAAKNHAGAQYNLGIMSYLGQGVPQDYTQAALWFHKAGEQDHAAAQYNLGFLYFEGKGVEKDSLQAFMWIDRSANLGDEKAIRARETLQKALPKEIFK